MKIMELHIIQSFPVTCLNRDDIGAPKSAVFGGVARARVSSQCWKRAIRLMAADISPSHYNGNRSHYFTAVLNAALAAKGLDIEAANTVSEEIISAVAKLDSKNKEKTSVALYLSPGEISAIAQCVADEYRENGKVNLKKGALKKMLSGAVIKDLSDIAVFGRMVADDHTLMLEGAGMFSHALSTHRVSNDLDFFSAVDDLKPEDAEGAGHIGTLEFNSACYYRYVGLNLDLLRDSDHLGALSEDEMRTVVDTFLRSCILAVPMARKNSMNGNTFPSFVLGTVRTGQPLSMANAFETPVRSNDGYVAKSVDALVKHYDGIKETYGISGDLECRLPDVTLDKFCAEMTSHVN